MKTSVVLILCLVASFVVYTASGVASSQTYARDTHEAIALDSSEAEAGIAVGGTFWSTQPAPREDQVVLQSPWTENLGVLRFVTVEEWAGHNPWFGTGGQPITETGGKVYTTDFAVGLNIRTHNTADETILSMPFYRPDGSLYDEGRMLYDLDTDTWYEWGGWPVPGWWPIRIGYPEDPVYRDFGWTQSMPIQSSDPIGIWTINFLVNGSLTYSEQFELVPKPKVELTKAVMVTPSGLGVDLRVDFTRMPEEEQRFVRLTATVNGVEIEQEFDVTDLVEPAEGEKEILFDDGELSGTAEPRILDFAAFSVPRFEESQTFDLTAEAYTSDEGLPESDPDVEEVQICLPAVMVHGYMGPDFWDTFLGKVAGPAIYDSLADYLHDQTQGDFITGYTTDASWYKTLWLEYYSSASNPTEVSWWLDGLCDDAQTSTYADQVDLVCHSLGGLIGRYYASFQGTGRVRKVVMIGTPNSGSSDFYVRSSRKKMDEVAFILDNHELVLWMAPIDPCLYDYDRKSKAWTELDPRWDIIRPDDWPWLFPEQFPDSTWPPSGVTYYSIYSDAHSTPWELQVQPRDHRKRGFNWYVVEDPWLLPYPGDGTVTIWSAALTSAVNMPVTAGKQHAFLPSDPIVQARVLACLESP